MRISEANEAQHSLVNACTDTESPSYTDDESRYDTKQPITTINKKYDTIQIGWHRV